MRAARPGLLDQFKDREWPWVVLWASDDCKSFDVALGLPDGVLLRVHRLVSAGLNGAAAVTSTVTLIPDFDVDGLQYLYAKKRTQ